MHKVWLEKRAERDLRRLPANVFDRVVKAIQELSVTPRPPGCRRITGSENDWRVRCGDYRVLYEIDDAGSAVRVLRVKHRREAYR